MSIALYFSVGFMLGWFYFRSLWWNAKRFSMGGHVSTMIFLMLGRFALLGVILTLVSFKGATPLLVMALGILIARPLVMRQARGRAAL